MESKLGSSPWLGGARQLTRFLFYFYPHYVEYDDAEKPCYGERVRGSMVHHRVTFGIDV